MKLLFVIAISLLLATAIITLADFEPGFVLLQYNSWSLETSLILFIAGFLLLLVFGYIGLRSLVLLGQTPKKLAKWNEAKRHSRAARALTRGQIALEEGRWSEAERILIRHAANSETPLIHYLAAARSAQKQDATDRRDNYLRLANETSEGAEVAVGVVQVELQLEAQQQELALETLQHLREIAPKHPHVLQLLQQVYVDRNEWQSMQGVLPDLRRRHVIDSTAALALTQDVTVGQLEEAIASEDWQAMSQVWHKATIKARQTESILVPYVKGLIQQVEYGQAADLIEQYMAKQWSDSLVELYGTIADDDSIKRLAKAEKWLKGNEDNAVLLLALGRIAQSNQLWAKAEAYLKSSLAVSEQAETYQVLAEVLESDGNTEQATSLYKQGLAFSLAKQA
jgi:HemY protein